MDASQLVTTEDQTLALQMIERVLDRGGLVSLTGPYGTGKTTLALVLRDRLQRSGVHVAVLTAYSGVRAFSANLRKAIESAGPSPLVIMIDELERIDPPRWRRTREFAKVQGLLDQVVSRGRQNGVVFIFVPSLDLTALLPERLLDRMVTVKLGTILRGRKPDEIRRLVSARIAAQSRSSVDVKRLNASFQQLRSIHGGINAALGDATTRSAIAVGLVALLRGESFQRMESIGPVLEHAEIIERKNGKWELAPWLTNVIQESVPVDARHRLECLENAVSGALEAFLWEKFLKHLMDMRPWLSSEVAACGVELPIAKGTLPILVTRRSLKPSEFVAGLFRPSDLQELTRPDDKRPKELILEEAFEAWRENLS